MPTPPPDPRPADLLGDDDLAALPAERPDRTVRYGEHPDQLVDVYLPAAGPATGLPVAVLIHGGCWTEPWDRTYFGAAARTLSGRGIAAVNVEYRRLPAPDASEAAGPDAGGWPATFDDVAAAIDVLADVDAPLDLDRVVAVGHSAGGHLAQWLTIRPYLPGGVPGSGPRRVELRGALILAGVPDLVRAVDLEVCGDAAVRLLGVTPERDPERYRLASPSAQPEATARVVHLVGADDDVVPASYLQGCVLHGPLHVLPACGHLEPVVPGTDAFERATRELEALLR